MARSKSTASRFLQSATQSGLVTEQELEDAEQQLKANGIDATSGAISELLVRTNVITEYQAEQLKAGRTKFTLGPYIITDWLGG